MRDTERKSRSMAWGVLAVVLAVLASTAPVHAGRCPGSTAR